MRGFITQLANLTAIVGGVTLGLLALMTCVSVTGRAFSWLGMGPIPGDYEIVEAGVAFAIFCFLPICQLRGGHATVDLFTSRLGPAINQVIAAFWEVIFAAVLIFITWRLYEGFLGKLSNGQTSMFYQFPIWWPYLACLIASVIAAIVGVWSAADRILRRTREDQRGDLWRE